MHHPFYRDHRPRSPTRNRGVVGEVDNRYKRFCALGDDPVSGGLAIGFSVEAAIIRNSDSKLFPPVSPRVEQLVSDLCH